jgi:hypothetical protein
MLFLVFGFPPMSSLVNAPNRFGAPSLCTPAHGQQKHLAIHLKMMMCAQNPKAAVDSLHVKKLIVLLVALGALLSAYTGQIRIQDGHDGNEGGGFCPPRTGQEGQLLSYSNRLGSAQSG